MLDRFATLFSSDALLPHGMCILWRPELVWLHVGSDVLIAGAYFSIPFLLLYFALKRDDLAFRSVFLLFGLFIVACGTTHLMSIWTLWNPDYGVEGLVKAVTATASVGTAIATWRIMPKALALPSPGQLSRENQERRRAEAEVVALNRTLEARVLSRTAELEAANARLSQALKDKEVLLREVHHRVKNNLQVVSSLLAIQARTVAPALMPHYEESLQRIRTMTRLHQQIYGSADVGALDLKDFLESMCRDLGRIYGGEADGSITCNVSAEPLRLDLDKATPVVLIVNEVLSNAFKHAFRDRRRDGRIDIDVRRRDRGAVIRIADNGPGLPADFEERRKSSMGMRLIDGLAGQIGAVSRFVSEGGTAFTLEIPAERDGGTA